MISPRRIASSERELDDEAREPPPLDVAGGSDDLGNLELLCARCHRQ